MARYGDSAGSPRWGRSLPATFESRLDENTVVTPSSYSIETRRCLEASLLLPVAREKREDADPCLQIIHCRAPIDRPSVDLVMR